MNDREKSVKRFEEWEHYALEDEEIIKITLQEDGPPNQICLHVQQMAEKYLKGFLAFHKNAPFKTHQLDQLILECAKHDDAFLELKKDAVNLNDFYIEARYPGDIPEFYLQDAQEGYAAAKKIKDFVISKVKNS
jgi:HEPN domain-containing protein